MGRHFLLLKPTTTTTTTISFSFLLLLATVLFFPAAADPDGLQQARVSAQLFGGDNVSSANPSPSQPQPPPPPLRPDPRVTSFRPTIAIIVGVLTTLFSITFLLLLYAKHCKHGGFVVVSGGGGNSNAGLSGPDLRKNSGIDRSIVESLPVFRFGSLRGQKTGLDCAVCLTRFGPTDVLRLLPKCKHAFHVECVDTWLDAHSTCPLCRYRVDPEDVLLIDDPAKILHPKSNDVVVEIENDPGIRRISGRHSFAGAAAAEQKPGHGFLAASFRRSVDSWASFKRKKPDPVAASAGCLDRPRKDGLLLAHQDRTKLEHRIIVSPGSEPGLFGAHQRWSDLQPSDLLYLRSEMILREGLKSSRQRNENNNSDNVRVQGIAAVPAKVGLAGSVGPGGVYGPGRRSWSCGGGTGGVSSAINTRSVSEITGLSRFSNREPRRSNGEGLSHHEQRQLKLVSRWLAWVASLSRPGVRAERTASNSSTTTPTTSDNTPPPANC